jgi:DNA-binding NtrC family response regulator
MLRNHLHGLHVARALRSVDAGMPTILMTGFPSEELKSAARSSRVLQFIEKPFEIESLEAAVLRAAHRSEVRREEVPFGVVIADRNGFVVSISDRARQMFRRIEAGSRPGHLAEIFDDRNTALLDASLADWTSVGAKGPRRIRWWIRSRRQGAFRTFVLLPERRRYLHTDARIALLLDLAAPLSNGLTAGRRLLIIDDRSEPTPSYLDALEQIGCVAYRADGLALGLRLFREDPAIDVVVIDCLPSTELESALAELRESRPEAEIVGTSDTPVEEDIFARAGVTRCLHRPWRVGDLVAVLQE